ncbi:MAG: type III pantothenate kinase [Desulforegulaceae bacterium]|nr:type III pantothenate kinase [Desulforegulaceae bacterium]
MLLAIDVGNTNTVIGIFKDKKILKHWRVSTRKQATKDEFAIIVKSLFSESSISEKEITKVLVSSVVPETDHIIKDFSRDYLKNANIHWINSKSVSKLMPILYSNPMEVGADRIINGIAAYKKFKTSLIIIDFGTATTFDVISSNGEYLGGAISPGIKIAAEALYNIASKLPRVEIYDPPPNAIGKDTISSMKSGILYGYAALVDGMVEKIKKETLGNPMVIATGGLAVVMEKITTSIESIEPQLTLEGMLAVNEIF